MPKEVTTTGAIAKYFPDRRSPKKGRKYPMMTEAKLAVMLVERYGLSHRAALRVVLESDADAAGKLIAQKVAPDDKKEQDDLAKKYKEQIKKQMDQMQGNDPDEADDIPAEADDLDKIPDEADDDEREDDDPAATC